MGSLKKSNHGTFKENAHGFIGCPTFKLPSHRLKNIPWIYRNLCDFQYFQHIQFGESTTVGRAFQQRLDV
jgi:hypothetical protein